MDQGAHVSLEPPKDFDFYGEYRKRLQTKLDQKIAQIARDELLVEEALSGEERRSLQASLSRAVSERDEIKLLIEQIDQQRKE